MSRRLKSLAVAGVLLLAGGGVLSAQQSPPPSNSSPSSPPQRTFDYWLPDWMIKELWGPGEMPKGMRVRLLRHSTFTQFGVPEAYQGARSTVEKSPATIAAGRTLYQAQCASCHGVDGLGSGEPGKALTPSPALLAYMIRRPIAVDEYLLWAISDGGKPFDTEMPAYRDKLSRDDIWRIITYMRAGFPD